MTLQPPLESLSDYRFSFRASTVQVLANFRLEWQKTAEGKSLIDVQAPIGQILSDIANQLQLDQQERHVILGERLVNEVDCILEDQISVKFSS